MTSNRMILNGMLINLTANELHISSSVVGQKVFSVPKRVSLITFEERLFPQSFHPKDMNKRPELTFTVSLLLLPRISLKHACDKAVFCCASGRDSILEVPPSQKGTWRESHIHPGYMDWKTLSE